MPSQNQSDQIEVATSLLTEVSRRALIKLGLSMSDAQIVLDVLMYAQIRGSTQGLIKIVERTVAPSPDARPIEVQKTMPAMARIAANGNTGMVVMTQASDLAVQIASDNGVGVVTTFGTASSSGAIGYYASRIASRHMIGLVLAGSPPSTALFGGVDPVVGTNPIAIAAPGTNDCLVFDMATAATTVFGLIEARESGHSIAPGLAWDKDGNPTQDADAALHGAIQTFGGRKGSGLALMFEVLVGVLTGASMSCDATDNRGNFVLALDPNGAIGREAFCDRLDRLVSHIQNSRAADPTQPVRLPGQGAAQRARAAAQSGKTPISSRIWQELQAMA